VQPPFPTDTAPAPADITVDDSCLLSIGIENCSAMILATDPPAPERLWPVAAQSAL
jgi:hypothetical protein